MNKARAKEFNEIVPWKRLFDLPIRVRDLRPTRTVYVGKSVLHLFEDCTHLRGDPVDKDVETRFDDEFVCERCVERYRDLRGELTVVDYGEKYCYDCYPDRTTWHSGVES